MSDIRLYKGHGDRLELLNGGAVSVEKSLQTLIEANLETLLGVRFLASEYSTTKSHGGRIDTLGIDESHCPVIIEYKRALNENVMNQGLFYLDWLLDHRADFTLLVIEKLGQEASREIEWAVPRLICIASDFTKYDLHAIGQMPKNIDLIRYRRYGDDLLLLEHVATHSAAEGRPRVAPETAAPKVAQAPDTGKPKSLVILEKCSPNVADWFAEIRAFALGLGDNVQEYAIDRYVAFRSVKNFAYVRFRPTVSRIIIELSLDPQTVSSNPDFVKKPASRNRLPRITIDSDEDLQRVMPLIAESYQRR